jgi:hypothetical protein
MSDQSMLRKHNTMHHPQHKCSAYRRLINKCSARITVRSYKIWQGFHESGGKLASNWPRCVVLAMLQRQTWDCRIVAAAYDPEQRALDLSPRKRQVVSHTPIPTQVADERSALASHFELCRIKKNKKNFLVM